MTDVNQFHSPTSVGQSMQDLWWLPDPYRKGSTGKLGLNRAFKADMLNACRTVVFNVSNKTKGSLWWLDLLHLQREGSTGKKDLNKALMTETPNGHVIMVIHFRIKIPGDS